jgi:putative SOS response-associated peptidase YedK
VLSVTHKNADSSFYVWKKKKMMKQIPLQKRQFWMKEDADECSIAAGLMFLVEVEPPGKPSMMTLITTRSK